MAPGYDTGETRMTVRPAGTVIPGYARVATVKQSDKPSGKGIFPIRFSYPLGKPFRVRFRCAGVYYAEQRVFTRE